MKNRNLQAAYQSMALESGAGKAEPPATTLEADDDTDSPDAQED